MSAVEPDPALWPHEVQPGDVEIIETYATIGTARVMLIRQPWVGTAGRRSLSSSGPARRWRWWRPSRTMGCTSTSSLPGSPR